MMLASLKLRLLLAFCLLPALLAFSFTLHADEFRPALLEVTEQDGGWVEVKWKVPMLGEQVLALTPVLPEFFTPMGPGSSHRVPGALIETSSFSTSGRALNGATVGVDGLSAVPADVVVQVNLLDGSEHSAILRSNNPSFTIPDEVTNSELAGSYWSMGTIHILEGLILLAWLKLFYHKFLNQMMQSVSNYQLSAKLLRDQNLFSKRVAIALNINFIFIGGAFIYLIFGYYNLQPFRLNDILSYLCYSGCLMLLLLVRYVVLHITGYLFDNHNVFKEYLHQIFL
ncbi:MAG: DUF4271 domain-containing protein, partial [Gammaproteobacteria bacterium]|nr:DUF4271 domain-containing protein [Gammaproteobacteria bacterium]